MKVYQTNEIKNIALIGSAGSGKTTLAEAMLFESGVIKRRGSVEQKNTVSDYFPVEQEYGYSVFSTVLHTEWNGKKLNIIDHYTCFTSGVPLQGAGGLDARGDVGSGNLRQGTGPRLCRHGGVQEGRRSPTFSCGVLPSLHPWGRRPMPAGAGAADRNTRRSPA